MHLFWKTLKWKTSNGKILIREGGPYHTTHARLILTCQHSSQLANQTNGLQELKNNNLKTCLCMRACEYIQYIYIYTVHPSGLLTNTPNQQTEPLDSVDPLIHYKAPLIFKHLWPQVQGRFLLVEIHEPNPRSELPVCKSGEEAVQICKSVSAECVKNTSRNPLVYWKCNEHLRTLWKAEIWSRGGPDMWVYSPAAVA